VTKPPVEKARCRVGPSPPSPAVQHLTALKCGPRCPARCFLGALLPFYRRNPIERVWALTLNDTERTSEIGRGPVDRQLHCLASAISSTGVRRPRRLKAPWLQDVLPLGRAGLAPANPTRFLPTGSGRPKLRIEAHELTARPRRWRTMTATCGRSSKTHVRGRCATVAGPRTHRC
jgi:hypothetical protein